MTAVALSTVFDKTLGLVFICKPLEEISLKLIAPMLSLPLGSQAVYKISEQ